MADYTDDNVFMIYGFEKNGSDDPEEITKAGIENNAIMKCPVLAADAPMALAMFAEKYPSVMVAGIVNLADMKVEVASMEAFLASQE